MGDFFDRRRAIWLGLVVAAASLLAFLGSCTGGGERIAIYRTNAVIDPVGDAVVFETIDYDFKHNERHGIFRKVRGLDPEADISVSSPTAPDDFVLERTTIRIGSDSTTVDGRHRYEIRFPLDLTDAETGDPRPDLLEWQAVGADWDVGIDRVEAFLVTPVRLANVFCAPSACSIDTSDPGRIVATAEGLDAGQAVTIRATITEEAVPVSSAERTLLPPPPSGEPDGSSRSAVTGLAALSSLGGLLLALALIVGAGRDEFRDPDVNGGEPRRLFPWQLARRVGLAEAPPDGLRAWQAGILVADKVTADHSAAWLLELATDGDVQIDGPQGRPTVRRTADDSTPDDMLELLFGGVDEVRLGRYHTIASYGWRSICRRLEGWIDGSEMWTEASRRRARRVEVPSMVTMAFAGFATIGAGAAAVRFGGAASILLAVAGAVLGASGGLLVCRRALLVRSPAGTALWLQVEGFRRYLLRGLDHSRSRAAGDDLPPFAAWAVAFGLGHRWKAMFPEDHLATYCATLGAVGQATTVIPNVTRRGSSSSRRSTDSGAFFSSGGSFGGDSGGGSSGGGGGDGGGSW